MKWMNCLVELDSFHATQMYGHRKVVNKNLVRSTAIIWTTETVM